MTCKRPQTRFGLVNGPVNDGGLPPSSAQKLTRGARKQTTRCRSAFTNSLKYFLREARRQNRIRARISRTSLRPSDTDCDFAQPRRPCRGRALIGMGLLS